MATEEKIREVVESYLRLVANGTAEEIADLYADGATVEDPVGTEVRTTREQIVEFYAAIESMQQTTAMRELRIAGGEAAFCFEIVTDLGESTLTLAPIDVMTFDEEGKITSMRAFWSSADMVTG